MRHTGLGIHVLRGMCVISLLLCHNALPECPEMLLALHAGLFCALEGACKETREDLRGAFVRFMVPYILACLGMAVICGASGILVYRDLSTESFTHCVYRALLAGFAAAEQTNNLAGAVVNTGVPVMWILPVLFLARIFAELVQRICADKRGCAAAATALGVAGLVSLRFVRLPFGLQYAPFGTVLMLLGECLAGQDAKAKEAAKRNVLAKGISLAGEHTEIILAAYGAMMWSLSWITVPGVHIPLAFAAAWIVKKAGGCLMSCMGGCAQDVRRDPTADIMKGVMICLMILGHEQLDAGFRRVIYSVHMMVFVFLSGYFYRGGKSSQFLSEIRKLLRSVLIPYAGFGVLYVALGTGELWHRVQAWALAVGMRGRIDFGVVSIGPMYFVPMLLCVRAMYLIAAHLTRCESGKTAVVVMMSLLGAWMGRKGYWLPWSFDCALYCLACYHAGYLCRKHDVLEQLWKKLWLFIPLCCLWAVMIADGGMEIFVRQYGRYALVVAGSTAGVMVIWMGCRALAVIPGVCSLARLVGRNTMYILWMHTLFAERMKGFLYAQFDISRTGLISFGACLALQVAAGIIIGITLDSLKRANHERRFGFR